MHFTFADTCYTMGNWEVSLLTCSSYVLDWVLYLTLIGIVAVMSRGAPRYTEFSLQDYNLAYYYYPESTTAIPFWLLILLAIVIPVAQVFLEAVLDFKSSKKRRLWDLHVGLLALSGVIAFNLVFVSVVKNNTGLPRPDMLARCQPWNWNAPPLGQLSNVGICSSPYLSILNAGFRSFPSGHAALIFATSTLLGLMSAGRLRIADGRGLAIKSIFVLSHFITATYVSATRVSDNRHFLRDVIAGAVLGIIVAVFTYHIYYPPIWNIENGGRAYPPRRFGIDMYHNGVGGFWKLGEEPGAYKGRTKVPGEESSYDQGYDDDNDTPVEGVYSPPEPSRATYPKTTERRHFSGGGISLHKKISKALNIEKK